MITCPDCSGIYKNKYSLNTHRSKFHISREKSTSSRFEPYPMNTYKCIECGERFPNLTTLFQHKQKYHPGISIIDRSLYGQAKSDDHSKSFISSATSEKTNINPIIINHSSHEEEKRNENSNGLIPEENNISTRPAISAIDTDPKPTKRRRSDTDSEIAFDVSLAPPKIKSTNDSHPPKKRRYKNSNESDYSADDEDDEENNNWSGLKTLNKSERYKSMYQKYRRDSDVWKKRFKRLEAECHRQINENEALINDHETNCKRRLAEKEALVINLNTEKRDYKDKIKFLQNHIAEFDKDSPQFNNISKALFNCISIGEMNNLRNLFKEKKYSEIYKEKNVKIIQKIFIGLNNGVIPICNPQSTVITEEQRDIIESMEDASTKKAKKLLVDNMELIVELFDIVDSSIKMIVDLYYRFGSKDEDIQINSILETDEYQGDWEIDSDFNEDESVDGDSSEDI